MSLFAATGKDAMGVFITDHLQRYTYRRTQLEQSSKGSMCARHRQEDGQNEGEGETEKARLRDGGSKKLVNRKRNETVHDIDGIKRA